ncbi:LOW QUALITY PROTEIN: proline-rich protein PRCC-like [Petaurus breviceps papuanus]|uniref:LOW QUALITY PROTEIN: proline-rich protein PRCC-like n=1 Tax=Petaurus breviceps papuanus TaxID=3040969 RepID=UPI0036DC0A6D
MEIKINQTPAQGDKPRKLIAFFCTSLPFSHFSAVSAEKKSIPCLHSFNVSLKSALNFGSLSSLDRVSDRVGLMVKDRRNGHVGKGSDGQMVRVGFRGADLFPLNKSNSEEDEPTKKKTVLQGSGEGTGLSALLPQPKNLTTKETNRLLLPYAFSRKTTDGSSDTKLSKPSPKTKSASSTSSSSAPVVGATTTTPSPSAIKAAAKSAALQVTKQITQEEDDSDEEVAPENFFSLPDKAEPPGAEPYPYPVPAASEEPPPGTEPDPTFQDDAANAPLEFKMMAGSSGAPWVPKPGEDYSSQPYNQFPTYGDVNATGVYYQDYYSSGYYPESDPALAPPQEITPDASFIDDEAFKRLQGKRNRGRGGASESESESQKKRKPEKAKADSQAATISSSSSITVIDKKTGIDDAWVPCSRSGTGTIPTVPHYQVHKTMPGQPTSTTPRN